MTDARGNILAALRAGKGALAGDGYGGARNPLPARAQGTRDELIVRFIAMAGEAAATLARVSSPAAVPAAVASCLREFGCPPRIAVAPDALLRDLDWRAAGLDARFGPGPADDGVSVTPAIAGIAETGTLLVRSGAETPNRLHLLPETHIAVLRAADIVGGYEAGLARLEAGDNAGLPRAVTLITGPSRSSDIERVVQIGVHGPGRLHIVLIDGEETG